MTTRWELANILFPDVNESIEDLLKKYPEREEKKVLRFAPSPTWYLHFWGLYTSFIGWKYAKQNNGKMLLRIEDTDQKREIEWAAELLIQALKNFEHMDHIHNLRELIFIEYLQNILLLND